MKSSCIFNTHLLFGNNLTLLKNKINQKHVFIFNKHIHKKIPNLRYDEKTSRGHGHQRNSTAVAYMESDEIHDWRIKKMSDVCHSYFTDLWSKGILTNY